MTLVRRIASALLLLLLLSPPAVAVTRSDDRKAIMVLLDTYQDAVTRKDQARFETLLLAKDIPFSFVPADPVSDNSKDYRNYDAFRRGVFAGPPFTQRFRSIHISQRGALADVNLVYDNDAGQGPRSGWKTMQLIKVGEKWKIASEFFTNLPTFNFSNDQRKRKINNKQG